MRVMCEQHCTNYAVHFHKGEYYCYPHYLAATADGQLFNTPTNLRKERGL